MPDSILKPIVSQWYTKIKASQEVKADLFQRDADEGMKFFNGPYDWLYNRASHRSLAGVADDNDEGWPAPSFKMTCNKVAEMVQLFGPVLYHKNPQRTVTPRQFPELPQWLFGNPTDPLAQLQQQVIAQQQDMARQIDSARSILISALLNYTPNDLGLKDESRAAIDEAIIKGMGLLWTEVYKPPGSNFKMVGSFFDTVDNFTADPDAERQEDWKWVARRCIHPVWEVEREYGLPQGSLKGNRESWNSYAETSGDRDRLDRRSRAETADIIVYWKIWSKMGIGGRLSGVPAEYRQVLEQFGDYCYLVVAEHIDYPLNLPPDVIQSAPLSEVMPRIQWETPFWREGGWPFTPIQFHPVPRSAWPMSHLKPGLGELKFLNWAYSFLATRIKLTSRQIIGIQKSAGEEIVNSVKNGPDLTILELDAMHQKMAELVQFIQHPQVNDDLLKTIDLVATEFEKRTGLTELMYGESPRQYRSAEEAHVKQSQVQVRPDDMTARVEESMSEIAKKEAIASRWHLQGSDITPILGPAAGYLWDKIVAAGDPTEMSRSLDYRIEADSTRKPNRERMAANMTQAMQNLFQPLLNLAMQSGVVMQYNALVSDWAKSIDLDPRPYLLPQPQQLPPGAAPGGPPAAPGGPPPPAAGPPPHAPGAPQPHPGPPR